jgi:hypothetical protein
VAAIAKTMVVRLTFTSSFVHFVTHPRRHSSTRAEMRWSADGVRCLCAATNPHTIYNYRATNRNWAARNHCTAWPDAASPDDALGTNGCVGLGCFDDERPAKSCDGENGENERAHL